MQPLIATRDFPEAPMAPAPAAISPRRDPAPSRVAYRLHRLWLTPFFRALLRKGLPTFAVVFGLGLYFQSEGRRAGFTDWAESVRQSIAERPEFMVQMMSVEGASPDLADAIREVVPQRFPVSSFEMDLEAMQHAVAELPAVATADVRVRRGGVLEIAVTERHPAVVWRSRTGIGTLDGTGHAVSPLLARLERPDLPLIVGTGADAAVPEALALIAAAGPIADRVRGLVRIGERRWDVVIDPDIRLMLPEADPVPALEQIVALNQSQEILDRDISAIDLRIPSRVTVRLNADAAATFREINALPTGAANP